MAIYHHIINQGKRPLLGGLVLHGKEKHTKTIELIALLDTGTYHTVVGIGIIRMLQLEGQQINSNPNFGTANGIANADTYKNIDVIFPKGEIFTVDINCLNVNYGETTPFNLAIGMDILSQGTFHTINGREYILQFP